MVKKYIRWLPPEEDSGFTHVRVWKRTAVGDWVEFTTSNDPSYTADGLPISRTYAIDNEGETGHVYKIRFYDKNNGVLSDFSDPMRGDDFRGYCTIKDVRDYTNIQSQEYSDSAIQSLIDGATSYIDLVTGRTWQGKFFVEDLLVDGNGKNFLFIHNDLDFVVSLSIEEDGVFKTVPSSEYMVYKETGGIYLKNRPFKEGKKNVRVSFYYGNENPTPDVRLLCTLIVANLMKTDATRTAVIDDLKNKLRVMDYQTI